MDGLSPESSARRDPVERLAEEFVERLRRGENPDVEAYAARHPELADEIRKAFVTLLLLERDRTLATACKAGLAVVGLVGDPA